MMDEYKDGYYHKPNPVPARRPPHPGIILQKEVEARGLDAKTFLKDLGIKSKMPVYFCDCLLKGTDTYRINDRIAFALEEILGINAAFWVVAQLNHDIWRWRKAGRICNS